MGLRWFKCLTISTSIALASVAGAETYTWTGEGVNNLWSNPFNWADGVVPVSATDSTIDLSSFPKWGFLSQDLSEDFDVGTLIGADESVTAQGISLLGHNLRVHRAAINTHFWIVDGSHVEISTHGTVSLTDTTAGPIYEPLWSRDGSRFGRLRLDGSTNVSGGWVVDELVGTGSIHLNENASLDAFTYPEPLNLLSLTGRGWFDIKGTINMVGGVPADLSNGVLDLGRNDQTFGANIGTSVNFNGDVNLGSWLFEGDGFAQSDDRIVDRLHVSGTLDLTRSRIHEFSYISADPPLGDRLLIATYGNRVGAFPDVTIPFRLYDFVYYVGEYPGQIYYTSGENAGPGEIWVVIPEPTTALTLGILLPLTLRGRR